MNTRTLLAPALVALCTAAWATPLQAQAELVATSWSSDVDRIHTDVRGAEGPVFAVFGTTDPTFTTGVRMLGLAPLDAQGNGHHALAVGPPSLLPPNFPVYLRAAYRTAGGGVAYSETNTLLLNPVPAERIDFSNAPGCEVIATGERLTEQWADVGVKIRVDTHGQGQPQMAVALDSGAPGSETDLATPGAGIGNWFYREKLLVVAGANGGFDGQGNVIDPTAEPAGGIVFFEFDQPTYLDRITLIDVDAPGSRMRCFNGSTMLAEIEIPVGGDNSSQTIGFPLEPVTRLTVNLRCAAAIAELSYLPCEERIDFDQSMTGIPLGLVEGEVMNEQLRGQYGVRVIADTHHPTNAGRAILTRAEGDALLEECEALVLAVAADPTDADHDGVVDSASPEPLGGLIVLDFDFDVTWRSARVSDVDGGEVSFFRAEDANGVVLGQFPLLVGADGEVQTVAPNLSGVRRIRLNLGGDGALVSLDYCADVHPDAAQGAQP